VDARDALAVARRDQLVRARTRGRNEIHAVLIRRLAGRPPVTDVFGVTIHRFGTRRSGVRLGSMALLRRAVVPARPARES